MVSIINDKEEAIKINAVDAITPIKVNLIDEYKAETATSADKMQVIPMSNEIIIHKGYSPFVLEETGTWFEYDNKLNAFVDTGITAGINDNIIGQINQNQNKINNIEKIIPNSLTNTELENLLQ